MKDGKTTSLVPRLRFPEFRDEAAWASDPMSKLYSFGRNNALSRDKLNYETGTVRNIHYGDIHTKFPALFDITKERVPFINDAEDVPEDGSPDYCVEGDLIFADASEDTNDVGKSMEVVHLNGERLLSGQHTILARRKDDTFIVGFGGHLFRAKHIRSQIEKEAQGTKVYAISATRLGNIDIVYPADKAEQRKIAACLTSLDALIAARGRKLAALAAHKKGLMQQLFPRPDESLPRLRFPEFRKEGEWVTKPFAELCEIKHGYAFESEFFSSEGEYVLLTPGNFYERGGYRDRGEQQKYYTGEIPQDYMLARGDMLIAMTEQAVGLLGSPILVPQSDRFLHNQRLGLITAKPGVPWVTEFFFHLFNTDSVRNAIQSTASGTKVRHTSPTKVGDITVPTPPSDAEQQRIAACLGSLDAALAAESQALSALRTHKKVLMQQLFPSVPYGE